jgi:hypothetical protein
VKNTNFASAQDKKTPPDYSTQRHKLALPEINKHTGINKFAYSKKVVSLRT